MQGLLLCGLAAAGTGCGVTEMHISLAEQKYTYDTMNTQSITLPPVPCFLNCTNLLRMAGIIDNRVQASCDTATNQCVADLSLTIVYIVNVAEDPAFKLGIAQSSADAVRDVTINYSVISQTNFDIDNVEVYIGPDGIMSKDATGVVPIGTIGPFAYGTTVKSGEGGPVPLFIPDGSPAHAQVVYNIKNPQVPFNFLLFLKVRLKPGQELPKGTLEVRMSPSVRLLNR
jgi:hypothetical protein